MENKVKKSDDCKYDTLEYYRLRVRELEVDRDTAGKEAKYYREQLSKSHEILGRTIHQLSERWDSVRLTEYYPTDNLWGKRTLKNPEGKYKERGELVYGEFNGQKLYSDVDDLDSAYKKITGKTKAECDEAEQKRHEEYKEEERKHKEAIPELTKEWIEKGNTILDEKYRELWAECVPIRLGDLYRGMELKNCLEIVDQLNKGKELEEVKPLIENQGHSGMSFGLVCSMVKSFCDRGAEFVSFVR